MTAGLIILQLIGTIATSLAWIPQAAAGLRSHDAGGVSRQAWFVGAAIGTMWALYGISSHTWLFALGEGLFAVGSLIVLATLTTPARTALGSVAGILGAVFLLIAIPETALGTVGVALSVLMRAAQLVKTVRTHDAAGVADSSWMLLAVAAGAWGTYGVFTSKWPITAGATMVVLNSLAVTAATRWVRKGETITPPANHRTQGI